MPTATSQDSPSRYSPARHSPIKVSSLGHDRRESSRPCRRLRNNQPSGLWESPAGGWQGWSFLSSILRLTLSRGADAAGCRLSGRGRPGAIQPSAELAAVARVDRHGARLRRGFGDGCAGSERGMADRAFGRRSGRNVPILRGNLCHARAALLLPAAVKRGGVEKSHRISGASHLLRYGLSNPLVVQL